MNGRACLHSPSISPGWPCPPTPSPFPVSRLYVPIPLTSQCSFLILAGRCGHHVVLVCPFHLPGRSAHLERSRSLANAFCGFISCFLAPPSSLDTPRMFSSLLEPQTRANEVSARTACKAYVFVIFLLPSLLTLTCFVRMVVVLHLRT